jgi:hypothetical protein
MTDPVTIAAALTPDDRAALLQLPADEWTQCRLSEPAVAALLVGYGIPLIALNGDWVRTTRIGAKVQRECRETVGG